VNDVNSNPVLSHNLNILFNFASLVGGLFLPYVTVLAHSFFLDILEKITLSIN